MRLTDRYGLQLTTESAAAADSYVDGMARLLGAASGAEERLRAALDHDPAFALASAALSFQQQLQPDRSVAVGLALVSSSQAKRATRRERQHVEVLRRAAAQDWPGARALAVTHLEEFPRDALVLAQLVRLVAYGGEVDRQERLVATVEPLARHYGDDPWFLALHGLALSEARQLGGATALIERGLDRAPGDNLLAHGRAHVSFEQGDDAAGRSYLAGWLAAHDGGLIRGHLRWHETLAVIALGDPAAALELYRAHQQDASMHDAASVLWRLWLRGVDVTADMQALVGRSARSGIIATFERSHEALVLAGIGDRTGLAALSRERPAGEIPSAGQALDVLLAGLQHVMAGDWAAAVPPLEAVCARSQVLGGSNEQRGVFDETLVAAYRHCGRSQEAQEVGERRLGGRVGPVAAVSR